MLAVSPTKEKIRPKNADIKMEKIELLIPRFHAGLQKIGDET